MKLRSSASALALAGALFTAGPPPASADTPGLPAEGSAVCREAAVSVRDLLNRSYGQKEDFLIHRLSCEGEETGETPVDTSVGEIPAGCECDIEFEVDKVRTTIRVRADGTVSEKKGGIHPPAWKLTFPVHIPVSG